MDLSSIEAKLEAELIRDLDEMSNLSVGSKDHVMAAGSIKNLYSAMVTAKHNSDSTRVQADKNEQDAILKDEENKGRLELEKGKLELETLRLDNERRKLDLEKEKLENEKAREEAKIDIEKASKNGQLMLDKWKNETQFEIERDRLRNNKAEVDGKLALDRNRLDVDKDRVDVEKSKIALETKKHNEATSQWQTESLQEWRKIENEEKWHSEQLKLENTKLANDLELRKAQNRVSLIDCCLDGGVALTKIAVGALAFGALLTFEQTGCVTSKGGLSWLTKMLF